MFFPLPCINSVTMGKLLHLLENQFLMSEMSVIKIILDSVSKSM